MNIFQTTVVRFGASEYISRIRPQSGASDSLSSGGLSDLYSNETSTSFVYQDRIGGGTYLGIGSHHNFDHICRTRPDQVVLVDVARSVTDHLVSFRALLKLAKNPFEFLCLAGSIMPIDEARKINITDDIQLQQAVNDHIFRTDRELESEPHGIKEVALKNLAYAKDHLSSEEEYQILESFIKHQCDPDNFNHGNTKMVLARLFDQTYYSYFLGHKNSWQSYQNDWLKSLESYNFLHRLALNNKIAVLEGDIASAEVIASIRQSLEEEGPAQQAKITTAYFSNVEKLLVLAGEYEEFIDGLRTLPWSDSLLILRTYSYITTHKVKPDNFYYQLKDPFFYQVLEGPLAKYFFEVGQLPADEKELVKFFLLGEALKALLVGPASLDQVRECFDQILAYLDKNNSGDRLFFKEERRQPPIACLDLPSLIDEFRTSISSSDK